MRIKCPYCGTRDIREFTYHGDASVKRPEPNSQLNNHIEFVYMRDNKKGKHTEYWHHSGGCRSFVKVVRDTFTHEISECVESHKPTKFKK